MPVKTPSAMFGMSLSAPAGPNPKTRRLRRRFTDRYTTPGRYTAVYQCRQGSRGPGCVAARKIQERQLKKNISIPFWVWPDCSLWPSFDLPLVLGVLGGVAVQRGHQVHGSGIGGGLLALLRLGGIKERGGMRGRMDLLQGA